MQAFTIELEKSLEAITLLSPDEAASSASSRNRTIVSASDSSSSNDASKRDVRRAIRRLERNLSQIEEFWFQQQIKEDGTSTVDKELLQHVTTPLLITVLRDVDINPLIDGIQEWVREEVFQLFEHACVAAGRILTLVDLNDEQIDCLVDCAANEMTEQQKNPPYSPFLVSLLQLLNQYLQHRPVLPLISSYESLRLVSFLATRCWNDLAAPSATDEGCTAMRSFLVYVLQHIATIKSQDGTKSAHEWWISQLIEDASSSGDNDSDASMSLRQLETFGKEFLEFLLDLLMIQSCEGETQFAILLHHISTAVTLVDILEIDLDLGSQLFETQWRRLFIEFTNAAVRAGNPEGTSELLIKMGRKVLVHGKLDVATQRASAIVLYMLIGSRNGLTQDISFLVEACSKFSTDPWTQSGILTCLLLPTVGNAKQSAVKMVKNANPSSPWNVLVASKLPRNKHPADIEDQILHTFMNQHSKPTDIASE